MKEIIALLVILVSVPLYSQWDQPKEKDSLKAVEKTYTYVPGDHELFFMPTAYTMEQGRAYFSDYELILLNFSIGVTSSTHIGLFTIFPITTSFLETVTVGGKQNYVRTEYFSAALWGSFTPKAQLYTLGNVFSIGRAQNSIHIGIALVGFTDNTDNVALYMIGAKTAFSRKVTGIIEFSSSSSIIKNNDFRGLLSLGIRFHGESIAWDLGGVRPLTENSGELLFLPFLKATYCF